MVRGPLADSIRDLSADQMAGPTSIVLVVLGLRYRHCMNRSIYTICCMNNIYIYTL